MTRSSDTVVDGEYALKYNGVGSNSAKHRVNISPDTEYELSVWMKIAPGSSGAMIVDTGDLFDDTCQFSIAADQAGEWINKRATFKSGDHREVQLRCFTSGNFDGTCYWDTISLNKTAGH